MILYYMVFCDVTKTEGATVSRRLELMVSAPMVCQ